MTRHTTKSTAGTLHLYVSRCQGVKSCIRAVHFILMSAWQSFPRFTPLLLLVLHAPNTDMFAFNSMPPEMVIEQPYDAKVCELGLI